MARSTARPAMQAQLVADVWKHLRNRDRRPRPEALKDRIRVVNQDDDNSPVRVDLFAEIGYWGVTAQDFVDELLAIDAATIELHVNSPGGDVFDGIAIMNALADHPATVNVVVDGIAASAASYIALAGDTVKMNRASQMMIHDAAGMCWGNASDMEEMKNLLDRISDTIAGIYADRAGGKAEDWRDLMRAETWYSATEAVDAGLADEAVSGPKAAEGDEDPDADPDEDGDDAEETEPAEGDDDSDEDPEGEPGGDADGSDSDEEEEPEPSARLQQAIALAFEQFNYAGRAQAPPPKTPAAVAVDITKIQAALKGAFQ